MSCIGKMLAILFTLFLGQCLAFNFFGESSSSAVRNLEGSLTEQEWNETCQMPLAGYEWVLSQRKQDFGWGDQTHRAIIVLALNDFGGTFKDEEETHLMKHQLEVELTRALLRNKTQPMLVSDLALYIHALIITKRDPRDFHGIDLVKILKNILDDCNCTPETTYTNVFAYLVLSDSRAIEKKHLETLRELLHKRATNRNEKEIKAIALHALACATSGGEFQQYSSFVTDFAATLARGQNKDGSFGNVYTTALIVQALTAAEYNSWDEAVAKDFLESRRRENINMVSTYYIEKALKARERNCLKTLYKGKTPEDDLPHQWPKSHYVQYTLKVGEYPEVYFTVTIKVPQNATFFDIMRMAEAEDSKFRFSWNLDESNQPAIYSISDIPNNAEESLYWRLIVETDVDHDRHQSRKREFKDSPRTLYPKKDSHMIYWYREAFAPIPDVQDS